MGHMKVLDNKVHRLWTFPALLFVLSWDIIRPNTDQLLIPALNGVDAYKVRLQDARLPKKRNEQLGLITILLPLASVYISPSELFSHDLEKFPDQVIPSTSLHVSRTRPSSFSGFPRISPRPSSANQNSPAASFFSQSYSV